MLTPRPYQLTGRDFLAVRRFALLADEMRVGKTPQAILAAKEVFAQRTLVVCPAIAVPHWNNEWWRWWKQAQVHPTVMSYDRAKIHAASILAESWDLVIVDEAHFAKNPEAQRTKLVYGKGGLGWHTKRMWALSGTPAPKHAAELWPMLKAFGATDLTYPQFVARYCYVDSLTLAIKGTKTSMIPELKEILAKVMLRRTRKEVAPDMPDIAFDFLEVQPEVQRDIAIPKDVSDEALSAWIDANRGSDREDRQAVALAKCQPLGDEIGFAINNDLLKQTVVFGWHVEPLKALCRGLVARDIRAETLTGETSSAERERIQAEFRAGKIQVVVANILAAGTAIDLSAASHGYFLELDWVPGNNVQAANRLISMDKKQPVTLDVVTWPGSADDRVQRVLLRRAKELSILY